MKVLIMTLGTRGDVQPFVALAQGLRGAGHEPLLVAPHRFAGFAESHGVPFAGVDDGPMRLLDGDRAGELLEGGIRSRLALMPKMAAMFTRVLEDSWAVARDAGADLVVHNGQIVAGQHVAEALRIPAVLALPIPMYVPTREFAWPGAELPGRLPGLLNRATFLGMGSTTAMFGHVVDRWRRDALHLPRRRGRHDPTRAHDGGRACVLHAISPTVLPRPADWPAEAELTGYWSLAGRPSPLPGDLEEFLAADEAPVFVGFGSMAGADPAATTATVLEAARRTGRRLVIGAGWGGLDTTDLPDYVHAVSDVDYRTLFPHVAAVVHHGGAGTTGTAFTSGRPQVVCPFVADQPFWGRRVESLGVGPAPVPQKRLTAGALAAAIEVATDQDARINAERIARAMREENGVATAVRSLEDVAARAR
ncbi:glycosyltransferase family 1 protein [Myceligenerans sp. TRM 65318]|uniref:Glycosyltransferase family 1 protein n=2 Tax=Myceligenerans pegani TaxID=2776917 RepID=A0ABR9N796_9MICO|nr:glycosyltransferase family 1 protein [Myceligenerans sp. TRM 65318]MBE3021188.1 glycosyltransferase family 1 protein [Myceligenerans sp. TRM 65318]